ncbi:MAG TPA: Type 1 glutamine amidotransferase-like domain-containing protein [Roseiflexaceae bacterium]|nr:Type 1 glutamine amidotransferase-like domain-containing protein [Roseiflexaceae bacterium]
MKLVLYSAQETPEDVQIDLAMRRLLPASEPRVGFVPTTPDDDGSWYRAKVPYYARYGVTLSPYVRLDDQTSPEQLDRLLACDGIHLSGGDTVALLAGLRRHGLHERLAAFARRGGVLIGVSAGAIVLTPQIESAFHGIYADERPPEPFDPTGLGLVGFAFWPHYREEDRPAVEALARCQGLTVYACADGAGLVVRDGAVSPIGPVVVATP